MQITPEQVREIAKEAAKEAVSDTLTALGIDMNNLVREQQVWAFMRTFQEGTHRGMRAAFTATIAAIATAVVGWAWFIFFGRHP